MPIVIHFAPLCARSATGGPARRSCDQPGAGLAVERGRLTDSVGQRRRRGDLWCSQYKRNRLAPFRSQVSSRGGDLAARRNVAAGRTTRLERLRGFGGSSGRALTCLCSRVALTDGTTRSPSRRVPSRPVRVVAARAGEPSARRARAARSPLSQPDGTSLHAAPAVRARLGDASTLSGSGSPICCGGTRGR